MLMFIYHSKPVLFVTLLGIDIVYKRHFLQFFSLEPIVCIIEKMAEASEFLNYFGSKKTTKKKQNSRISGILNCWEYSIVREMNYIIGIFAVLLQMSILLKIRELYAYLAIQCTILYASLKILLSPK